MNDKVSQHESNKARTDLVLKAEKQVHLAADDKLRREQLCFNKSPSKCLLLSFTSLSILPEIMLAALRLPDYFEFDTSKLANASLVLHSKLEKLTGNDKECVVLDLRSEISQR